jgi:hypothetical protein
MKLSLQAEHVGDLTLPFLEQRSYLHGTTLFEALRGHVSQDSTMTFKFAKRIESNCIRVWRYKNPSENKESYAASLVWRLGGKAEGLGVEPLTQALPLERLAYDESLVTSKLITRPGEVWFDGPSPFSFVATLIPMYKTLLKREHPMDMPGQWMFTRLDLDAHPQSWERLGLRLEGMAGNTLARSVIFRKSERIGLLYYSWVT